MGKDNESVRPTLDSLSLHPSTLKRMVAFENKLEYEGFEGDAIWWMVEQGTQLSLRQIGQTIGISHHAAKSVLDSLGLLIPSKSESLRRTYQANPELREASSTRMKAVAAGWSEEQRRRLVEAGNRRIERLHEDPEYREENRRRQAEVNQRTWSDPNFRARRSAMGQEYWADPEHKRLASEKAKREMEDPELRATSGARLKKMWEDPEYRKKMKQASEAYWEDPQHRAQMGARLTALRADPLFEARRTAAVARLWEDPDFRARNAEAMKAYSITPEGRQQRAEAGSRNMKANWANPQFREKMSALAKSLWSDPVFLEKYYLGLQTMWQDPEYRKAQSKRSSERMKRKWQDPDFRRKTLAAVREAMVQMDTHRSRPVNSVHGDRLDIGFAQSTWEANIARIFRTVGRAYETRAAFPIHIPQEIREAFPGLYQGDEAIISVDFFSLNPRGEMVVHEIMVHPLKNPRGVIKLELLGQQYPEIKVIAIDEDYYKSLAHRFRQSIDQNPAFCGWETYQDHLGNNPTKFAM